MPIRDQFLIFCFNVASKENVLNIENNSEDPGAEMVPVHSTTHPDIGSHCPHGVRVGVGKIMPHHPAESTFFYSANI